MRSSSQTFDTHLSAFKEVQEAPWGRLRYKIAGENLARHINARKLNVLDVGGGNGLDALPLAQQGHHITILDYSAEMLTEAEKNAQANEVSDRITFRQADITALPELFSAPQFDLVLCHNVLQYVEDPHRALKMMSEVLHPGGMISVISINRYSETFRRALQQLDPDSALESLGATTYQAVVFQTEMRVYAVKEMAQLLEQAGFTNLGEYGIRCVMDYIADNTIKYDPAFFAALEKLELALSDQSPYRLLARNYQIIAAKGP